MTKLRVMCSVITTSLFTGNVAIAEEAHGKAGSQFPPFDTSTFAPTLFWLFITFFALYLLMSRVALPRIGDTIDQRNAAIIRDVDIASALQKKAQDAGNAYEIVLAKAKASALTIGQSAKDEAAHQATERRQQVEAEMSAKVAAAELKILETKNKAMMNVSSIASEAAATIVQHLTGVNPSVDVVSNAISASLKN